MLEPAREGGLKLLKHIGEVLVGVGETDRPSCPTPISAASLIIYLSTLNIILMISQSCFCRC